MSNDDAGHAECPVEDRIADTHENQLARSIAHELAVMGALMQPIGADGTHHYLSTGCLHGDARMPDGTTGHQHCRSVTAANGDTKQPATCKFCDARCVCTCHGWNTSEGTPDDE